MAFGGLPSVVESGAPWGMNPIKTSLVSSALLAGFMLAGCGQQNAASAPAAAASAAPVAAGGAASHRDHGHGHHEVQRDRRSRRRPGEALKVTLTNAGALPKESMAHNWVLLKPGTDATAFVNAALGAKATDYFPVALADEVIAHLDLVGPHQTGEVEFNAPTAPGDYTYLCTFPAHFQVGMHGILTVK